MSIVKTPFYVRSSDNIHNLSGLVFFPNENIEFKGFFHIVHGMTEHIARYEKIMYDLAETGFLVFGYDHLGHGYTANDDSELGFIASKDGYDLLARDVEVFSSAVRKEYADKYYIEGKDTPYYLMGHSMGSFVVRVAAEKYVCPDKLIVMGTAGKNPMADAGLALVAIVKTLFGEKHISRLINNMAFGSYNKKFGGKKAGEKSPWLTTDSNVRNKYYDDKFCTFEFTVSAMGDLIRLIKECNRDDWFKNISKEMPILLVAGNNDPVGNYGQGVLEVEQRLKEQSANVKCILYSGARHEILNDFTYDEVKKDILDFVNG